MSSYASGETITSSSKDRDTIRDEWRAHINIALQEREEWLETAESKPVGDGESGESTGRKSGRRIVKIMP